jgi:hypothetical protein
MSTKCYLTENSNERREHDIWMGACYFTQLDTNAMLSVKTALLAFMYNIQQEQTALHQTNQILQLKLHQNTNVHVALS